jgi:serine phosphatase RsbU (regulator of sigma subunit)
MLKTDVAMAVEAPKTFKDVLYLTDQPDMAPEIKRLLKQHKLTFLVLSLDKFHKLINRLDLVGTVIIDVGGLNVSRQQLLARVIESLEMRNIGAIILGSKVELPVKSFSLAPVRSFAMTTTMESFSVDELWTRIGLNLAYRKKSTGLIVKPASPQIQSQEVFNNKLAEQLHMTGLLVDNLAEQLRMAGLVQRDFLPTQLPNTNEVQWAATFLPAEWVSGDIYDVVRIDEQHIGFYVADAIGHSMPAALLTIFIKQALVMRETIERNYRIFSPAEVMKNLNTRMAGQRLSGYQFATCCYCMLNTKTLQLTYSRAGHPYPVLIRPNSGPEQLDVQGPLLGVFERAEYAQRTLQLQQGDKLLIYSDGAEPVIGNFDDTRGFVFSEEFCNMGNQPIAEIMDWLNRIVQNKKTGQTDVDDITAVGLEIV